MKLFELANNYLQVMQGIEAADELTGEQIQEIETLNDTIEEKAKAVGAIIKNMEADLNSIEEARKSMAEREQRLERKIMGLKSYLKANLEQCQIKEVKSPWFDIKIKNNPMAVHVENEAIIPEEYFAKIELKKLDKLALKSALRCGLVIPGAHLQQGTRLEIL